MSRFDQPDPVSVSIGGCLCPGTPHAEDLVYLAPSLSAAGGMAAQGAIADASTDDGTVDGVALQELLWRVYRDHGVIGWNLLDDDGDPVPLSRDNKDRALPYSKGGRKVGDAADELYLEDVLTPFKERVAAVMKLAEQAKRSRRGSTTAGPKATSSTPTSTPKPRRRSSKPASVTPAA